ncbi:MAG: hypothetical protein L6R35_002307 [Caloplaca aegaea]|nr:MAG: hypothetical protein L6R35_002307 [Caloplaca aegaea]
MTEVAAAAAVEEEGTGVDVERGGGGGGAKETFKDLFAGAAGGVAQVLIDIIKVRLQTTTRYTGAVDAATKIFKDEGPLAFYKVGGGWAAEALGGVLMGVVGHADAVGGDRSPSNSAASTTPVGSSKPATPSTTAPPRFHTPNSTPPVPSPVLPTPSSLAPSSTFASGCRRNPTAQGNCIAGRSTACGNSGRTRAS